ncbi:hypothetical protein K438DRAFT_366921 [Mycena galopus ATCC 62051]|nr:hypothetical protein K438DRAFT_366921 [Mycena galopus ATCC 62051]
MADSHYTDGRLYRMSAIHHERGHHQPDPYPDLRRLMFSTCALFQDLASSSYSFFSGSWRDTVKARCTRTRSSSASSLPPRRWMVPLLSVGTRQRHQDPHGCHQYFSQTYMYSLHLLPGYRDWGSACGRFAFFFSWTYHRFPHTIRWPDIAAFATSSKERDGTRMLGPAGKINAGYACIFYSTTILCLLKEHIHRVCNLQVEVTSSSLTNLTDYVP